MSVAAMMRENKSLFQALESSPVVMLPAYCSANRSTFYGRNSKSVGLANARGQLKFDAIIREPCSYYDSTSVASEAISEYLFFKHFMKEHAPRPPF